MGCLNSKSAAQEGIAIPGSNGLEKKSSASTGSKELKEQRKESQNPSRSSQHSSEGSQHDATAVEPVDISSTTAAIATVLEPIVIPGSPEPTAALENGGMSPPLSPLPPSLSPTTFTTERRATPTGANGEEPMRLGSRLSARLTALATGRKNGSDLRVSNLNPENLKRRLSRSEHHPLAHEHVRDVVTHILGQKKDQDRAVCVPQLLPGVLYCGVFDGHGRDGEIRSELATTELPRIIKRELSKVTDEGKTLKEADMHSALDVAYSEFHQTLDKMYEDTVYRRAVELAAEKIKNETGVEYDPNEPPNVRMPQDGGTTATSVIVSGELIVVGWVGDSRAVLARRIAKKRGPILNRFSSRLKMSTLTEDHNVAANLEEEMNRVSEQGGEIYGKHLAADAVEGMLQLTRSLGDSPFHRTGLVVSKPGIVTIPVVDESVDPLLFLIVASDGLWDYFSNKEAMSFVYKKLKKDEYATEADQFRRSNILMDTARALEAEAVKRSTDRKSHSDDITVMLLTFARGWGIEADDAPSF